jgi:hypothetical protein
MAPAPEGKLKGQPMPERNSRATFIEPMLLLRTEKLPEGVEWLVELFLLI